MFFWLVVVGAVLLVGVVGCCGGLFLIMPDTKWQTHESKEGGFKVELPSKPHPDVARAADLQLEKGTKAEGTILLKRGGVRFVVIYRDIGSAKQRRKTDEQELNDRIDRLQRVLEAEQISSNPITVNGFPGREVTLQTRKYGWHAVRVIVADTRLYILFAGGGVALPGDPMVYRFLNSFEITEPELLQEGKRREQQAKLAPDAPKPGGDEKANPWKGRDDTEVADVAPGRAAEEAQKAQAAAKNLRGAAAEVAAFALTRAAEEAQAARDAAPVAPPVEVAPHPRPVGDSSSPSAVAPAAAVEVAPHPRPVRN
ncbi:hypothetical protein [Frigoriglobus tundricola]|uniref:Uncharacterized protein n=1 Tax=Frigoriglobus tundricola TaxID=2774151 RepID=A0A6M5YRR2_9BACT|nr:hypothetical protein [Frigoriglobus tundricola]QJW95662.1 hypothetical protein FTUN_3216 [Frigoriglobus tundricola]